MVGRVPESVEYREVSGYRNGGISARSGSQYRIFVQCKRWDWPGLWNVNVGSRHHSAHCARSSDAVGEVHFDTAVGNGHAHAYMDSTS